MLREPFYDPTRSYEENYQKGPFGAFVDGDVFVQKSAPQTNFLGHKVHVPFGIPAGPLVNSTFCKAAFEKGFDLCVYKTVRSDEFPCHPFPNVLAVHAQEDLTLDVLKRPLVADATYSEPLTITNSFGVPSRPVGIWQEDAKRAVQSAGEGQVLIMSFMGTAKLNQTKQELIDDYVLAARLSLETGASVYETNLSCPNIGNEGLVCYDLETTEGIAKRIREVLKDKKFILKVGYYQDDEGLEKLAEIAEAHADCVAGINTLQAEIRDAEGSQVLPGGPARLRSGVCGAGITWAGIDFVKRLAAIREKKGYSFAIQGIGGVMTPDDYKQYRDAGADSVMSATGAMWNPYLAQEIKEKYSNA